MFKYLFFIFMLTIVLIITLLNIGNSNSYISLNFLITRTPPIPGILVLYIGVLIGSLLTLPIIIQLRKNSKNKVVQQHMKEEEKRMKKIKKSITAPPKKNKKSSNINTENTVK